MKQEDVNTIVDRCINDFNFDCVLKFFRVFGNTESPKFWLNVPIDVVASCTWWHKPLTREILVETARDLLTSFLKNPKNDSENPFDWNMSHGGFSVEVLEVDENNEITAISLSWSPLSGEGWLNIPTHRIDQD